MEYSIDKLGKMAGVTSRTLRHYDQIGLLKPVRINSSGYRIYGSAEVDRLQQILFFRSLGVELAQIGKILDSPQSDPIELMYGHLRRLEAKREELGRLIGTVKKTIESKEKMIFMADKDKFEGFKKTLVDDNEARYGADIRKKYGDEEVNASNARMMNLSMEEYDRMQELSDKIIAMLERAVRENLPPEGETGGEAAQIHKDWLSYTWPSYDAGAHRSLVQMYVDDPRFTEFYDKNMPGCARFLRDAVLYHIK